MRKGLALSIVTAFLFAAVGFQPAHELCEGFLPENDMRIPVGSMEAKGITQDQFNAVMDSVERLYGPVIAARGGELEIRRLWENDTVNASAQRQGNKYILNMYGGLARHEAITQDGFALVVCHEMGHHIGGYPKISGWWNNWASNEGQSDYFANLKCLRRVFTDAKAAGFTRPLSNDPVAEEACGQAFGNQADQAVCLRNAMAGDSVTALFQALRNEDTRARFDTPDPNVVDRMYDRHPASQCRLDTYFQGSLCDKSVDEDVDSGSPEPGTCTRASGYAMGIRPLCWYKPPAKDAQPVPVAQGVREKLNKKGSVFSALQRKALWEGL